MLHYNFAYLNWLLHQVQHVHIDDWQWIDQYWRKDGQNKPEYGLHDVIGDLIFQYHKINITFGLLNKKTEIEKGQTWHLAMGRGLLHLDLLDGLENVEYGSISELSAARFFDTARLRPLTLYWYALIKYKFPVAEQSVP